MIIFVLRRRLRFFWGFYESAEIRYVEKELSPATDVIELGSSIGVVSSHIVRKLEPGRRFVGVEANTNLISILKRNLQSNARAEVNWKVLNRALTIGKSIVLFDFQKDHTANRRQLRSTRTCTEVPACSLTDLLKEECLNTYTLVCDIEGAEIDLLLLDREAFEGCVAIIIELHDTSFDGKKYKVDDMKEMIVSDLGFSLVSRRGNVFHFIRL